MNKFDKSLTKIVQICANIFFKFLLQFLEVITYTVFIKFVHATSSRVQLLVGFGYADVLGFSIIIIYYKVSCVHL